MSAQTETLFDLLACEATGSDDLLTFLSTPLEGMSRLALFGERCAAQQALERAGDDVCLCEYLRRRVEACDALLGA